MAIKVFFIKSRIYLPISVFFCTFAARSRTCVHMPAPHVIPTLSDLQSAKRKFAPKAQQNDTPLLNRCFITSGSRLDNESLEHKMFDDLTMWRMYADDCRGVCVKYRIDRDKLGEKYVLAPISYAKKRYITEPYDFDSEEIIGEESIHPELDFIHALMFCKEGGYEYRYSTFSFWKHFFKSFEYKDEQEVRLMYFADEDENVKWIQANDVFCPIIEKPIEKGKSEYPLQISEIVLGPKFHEREVNEKQIEYILSHENIDCFEGFDCNQSMIDNYR